MARMTAAIHRPRHDRPAPVLPHAVALLHTIPGGGARGAETLGSDIGTAMTPFPTAGHLASWAGMCPGHPQSAGQHLSGHTRPGKVDGRGALTQAAWAATRTKHTALAAPCRRLTTRLGKRRALVAVGHRMRVM